MKFVTFCIEVFFTYLLVAGTQRLLNKVIKDQLMQWLNGSKVFYRTILESVGLMVAVGSWESFFSLTYCSGMIRQWNLRRVDFSFGLLNLAYLQKMVFAIFFAILFSYVGLYSEVSDWALPAAGSSILTLLIDQSWTGVGFGFAVGLACSLLSRRSTIAVILASVFLFYRVVSVPCASFMVIGDIFGLWCMGIWQSRSSGLMYEVYARFLCTLACMIFYLMFGRTILENIYFILSPISGEPLLRWFGFILSFLSLDLIIGLATMHFYFGRTHEKKIIFRWPSRFMIKQWLPAWTFEPWTSLAEDRKKNLETQVVSLQETDKDQIPATLLRQAYDEIKAAENFIDNVR